MDDMLGILVIVGILAASWKVISFYDSLRWSVEGLLPLDRSRNARYRAGSYLAYRGTKFHGMWFIMPNAMPHIYIDNHADGTIVGPARYMPKKEKLSLEGNFDKHFQVFAPRQFHAFTLSVLTPDIMALLIDVINDCDIEIHGTSVRIMRARRFKKDSDEHHKLIAAAELLATELAHQTKGWSAADQQLALSKDITRQDSDSLKVGRSYISSLYLTLATFTLLHLAFIFWSLWLYWQGSETAAVPFCLSWMPLALYLMLEHYTYKSKYKKPGRLYWVVAVYTGIIGSGVIAILLFRLP